ncbi:hypothetical protein [Modestobacter sp. NPDC049651]|uniref:hypothetical protein n=1 Tax=unclassified Modestobacter TaxID=2643866 RepID=UPI0033FF4268
MHPPAPPTPRRAADDGLAGLLELFSADQPVPAAGAPLPALGGRLRSGAAQLSRRASEWGSGPEGARRAW